MPSSPPPERGPRGTLPGFIAVARDELLLDGVIGPFDGLTTTVGGPAKLTSWGLTALCAEPPTLALSRVRRTQGGSVSTEEITESMRSAPAALMRLLPPFAAVCGDDSGVTMVADSMGFRQLYHSAPDAAGPPVLGTSALLAGWLRGAELDDTAIAVQSLLGWQLGQRTLFRDVDKLAPGAIARLGTDGVRVIEPERVGDSRIGLVDAVAAAASALRASLAALLDDHPDAVLQLTGGQDSRLLLSAIPVSRRRGLRAMTLGVPGSGDVTVARQIAQRYGIRHDVHGLAALDGLSAAAGWDLVRDAAVTLDGMSDPVALAALTVAEGSFDQGVRISGLGGEIARGFYYVGSVRERTFTRKDAERLAGWRMFVNEAVEPGLLDPEFAAWARMAANDEVATALSSAGDEWFRATDDLYLRHRMQRWAGITDTAVGTRRTVVNPMLDAEFLSIASRLAPEDKAHSRFLARLQMELDPELGRLPLEGRAAPVAAAYPSPLRTVTGALGTGRRLSRKITQRLQHGNRPPAGGSVLAGKVVEHWREHPELLSTRTLTALVRSDWIDGVLDGRLEPRPSSVAFLTNLIVAGGQRKPRGTRTDA
jgi:asparagine synthase (glutamine-hydrolysing)